jgi:hypothetical protein
MGRVAIVFLLIVFAAAGCKKYDEGPLLSLRTKAVRLQNTWKVESYTYNGADQTSLTAGYTETYTKDGEYSFVWGSTTGSGRWEWMNDKEEIKRQGVSNQSSETLYILRLKENEFWYIIRDGNDVHEYHMVPAD